MIKLAPDNHIGHECTLVEEIPLDCKVMEVQEFNKVVPKNTITGSWRWGCYHDNQLYTANTFIKDKPLWATHVLVVKIVLNSNFLLK